MLGPKDVIETERGREHKKSKVAYVVNTEHDEIAAQFKRKFLCMNMKKNSITPRRPGIYEEIEKPRFPMIINYCFRVYDFTGLTLQFYVFV